MQINRATDYAVRVMIHLGTLPPGSKAQLISLEHATSVRGSFLSKVMQRLVHAGFVASHRGNGAASVSVWTATKLRSLRSLKLWKVPRTSTSAWQLATIANASPGAAFILSGQATLRDVLASVSIGQLSRDTEVSRSKHLQLVVPEIAEQNPGTLEVAANKGKCSPV